MQEVKKILMVDDDEHLLNSFKRELRNKFDLAISSNPNHSLERIKKGETFAVIISDYKMPDMDGNKFLSMVKDIAPNTSRILLTGFADISIATDAINNGNIFRFLTKPVETIQIIKSIEDAIEQFKLKTVEKDLIHNTLMGTLKVLVELLTLQNAELVQQSNFFSDLAKRIAYRLGERNTWTIELSILLSQIGCLATPRYIIQKFFSGEKITNDELLIFKQHPKIGKNLLNKIPRLESVATAIGNQFENYQETTALADSILQVIAEFQLLTSQKKSYAEAVHIIANNKVRFDPKVVAALIVEIDHIQEGYLIKSYLLNQLRVGAILVNDLIDENNIMLVPKGVEITEIMLYKLYNYDTVTKIVQPILVLEKK